MPGTTPLFHTTAMRSSIPFTPFGILVKSPLPIACVQQSEKPKRRNKNQIVTFWSALKVPSHKQLALKENLFFLLLTIVRSNRLQVARAEQLHQVCFCGRIPDKTLETKNKLLLSSFSQTKRRAHHKGGGVAKVAVPAVRAINTKSFKKINQLRPCFSLLSSFVAQTCGDGLAIHESSAPPPVGHHVGRAL